MQVDFEGQKHIFWLFLLCFRPHTSAGMNIKDALLQNIMIMASYCMFYFYSHRHLYTFGHLDISFTTITTINKFIYTVDALKII